LHKAITGDELWVFDYNPETKRQSKGMAHEKFSSEESIHEQMQGENHDYCFFSTAVALCTKNLYLQDRQLIMPSTKMSWNDFKNGSGKSEGTLQTTGCCNTIMRQLTLRFQFENFW